MSSKESEKVKKHICLGILAHVDAGKTTLSESMLYISGSIRKMGRVDHKDAFLIPMIWNVPEESLFFQNRQCFPGRIWG